MALNPLLFPRNQWAAFSENVLDKVLRSFVRLKAFLLQFSGKYFFFQITEPVASKAPTFSTDARSSTFVRIVGQSFGLLCQAQAFPVPIFRQVIYCYGEFIINLWCTREISFEVSSKVNIKFIYVEPIASAVPSITSTPKATILFHQSSSLAILCPAQGFPVPVSRCVIF